MVALMVAVPDKGREVSLEITEQEVILQQDAVFEFLIERSILTCVCG